MRQPPFPSRMKAPVRAPIFYQWLTRLAAFTEPRPVARS
jgi:hypothetical protein